MPSISLPAAIIGSSVVGAGASIAGGMANAGAAKSAAQTNANALTANNAASLAEAESVRARNEVLAHNNQVSNEADIYGGKAANDQTINDYGDEASRLFQPGVDQGTKASDAIGALLGIGGDPAAQTEALNNWANSAGMGFQLKTGSDAITGSKATAGLLNSGSTLKALDQYGQNVGSTYFGNYLAGLQGQQQAGASAANSLSNVLGNTANMRTGNQNFSINALTGSRGQTLNAITGANNNAANEVISSNANTTNGLIANNNNLLSATTAANNNTTGSVNSLLNNGVSALALSNGLRNPNASSFTNTRTSIV